MIFPFVAIEGQGRIKKALLLNIINEKIGGVLISGKKGSAKSTLVRGLEKILTDKKVINLPLNITEDNLVGSIDIEKTLKTGKKVFQEGILKKCHNNILYIDEINLLGESIISTILEVISREKNYIEREGISFSHDCKFILIGTMNPEEGDLRAGLLDKFGLYVNAEGSKDILERINIIKKRLEFEKNPIEFSEKYSEDEELLREKIFSAKEKFKKIKVSEQIMNIAIKFIEEANCLGNRAEIILIETAKSIAALDKRTYLNIDDLKEAATFVLPHRMNAKNKALPNEANNKHNDNTDNDSHQTNTQTDNSMNNSESAQETENNSQDNNIQKNENKDNDSLENFSEEEFDIGEIYKIKNIFLDNTKDKFKRKGTGKRCKTKSSSLQGRYIKSSIPRGKIRDFALDASIRAAAPYQLKKDDNSLMINIKKEHIRIKQREKRTGVSILFAVDSSGSMGVKKRMEAVKGAVMSLLKNAYEKRDKVGMLSFRRNRAEELLPFTRSIDLARKKLEKLSTGGKTPLSEGLLKAYNIIKTEMKRNKEVIPVLILLSDGKANFSFSGKDPVIESLEIAEKIKKEKIKCIVIDTEEGFIKLEMARTLSEAMEADYYRLDNIKSEDLIQLVKNNI
ncbi:VWA domain-containing protein [Fusobacterium nucleatum]|uniref:VWA domain-containing protein n=1 Tax=Fusobacterium nucleatum TaxID=851 RepID=UPI0030CE83AB